MMSHKLVNKLAEYAADTGLPGDRARSRPSLTPHAVPPVIEHSAPAVKPIDTTCSVLLRESVHRHV